MSEKEIRLNQLNNIQSEFSLPIIGYHYSPLTQKFGIPRQPNLVAVSSLIVVCEPYNTPDAFHGIESFSHLWITWLAHANNNAKTKSKDSNTVDNKLDLAVMNKQKDELNNKGVFKAKSTKPFKAKVRPPRLGGNTKLGVFATRSTYRPSTLGNSVVKLNKITTTDGGVELHLEGSDILDGTPIVDIKPYLAYSDAVYDAKCGFAPLKPQPKHVYINHRAVQQLDGVLNQYLTINDLEIICQLIAQDPRPAYRQNNINRGFKMRYKHFDIQFNMDDNHGMVITAIELV